jgi:hypothetical protein
VLATATTTSNHPTVQPAPSAAGAPSTSAPSRSAKVGKIPAGVLKDRLNVTAGKADVGDVAQAGSVVKKVVNDSISDGAHVGSALYAALCSDLGSTVYRMHSLVGLCPVVGCPSPLGLLTPASLPLTRAAIEVLLPCMRDGLGPARHKDIAGAKPQYGRGAAESDKKKRPPLVEADMDNARLLGVAEAVATGKPSRSLVIHPY